MSLFTCSNSTVSYIAKKFNVKEKHILELNKKYNELMNNIPYQYLAHIIRTLEVYIRENMSAPNFRITCKPMDLTKSNTSMLACASYQEGISFDIIYDKNAEEQQMRVSIAHELGHLFLVIMTDRKYDDSHEPLSSICGILTMLHKNEVSHKKQKLDENEIVDDFSLLFNRFLSQYNKS